MSSMRRAGFLFAAIALSLGLAGCSDKFWDPSQVGRFRPTPAVNVILDSLGAAEETPVAWENGEEPRPGDVVPVRTDYILSPGDLVRVLIFELLQEGIALVNDYTISETGKLSIPDVGIIQAAGLTETQLEEQIKQSLSPNILREPSVTVALMNSQQRTYSVLGNGVTRPSRYVIPRNDFRLMDALATAGAQMQFNVSYVYVSRKEENTAGIQTQEVGPVPVRESERRIPEAELELLKPEPPSSGLPAPNIPQPAPLQLNDTGAPVSSRADIPEPSEPAEKFETEREMLDLIAPQARRNTTAPGTSRPAHERVVATAAEAPRRPPDQVTATVLPPGFRLLVPKRAPTQNPVPAPSAPAQIVPSPVEFGGPTPRIAQAQPATGTPTQNDMSGKGPPMPQAAARTPSPASPSSTAKAQGRIEWIFRDGNWVPVPVAGDQSLALAVAQSEPAFAAAPRVPGQMDPGGGYDWVFRDGRWTTVPKGQASAPARSGATGNVTPPARPPVGSQGLQTPIRSGESGRGFPTRTTAVGGSKLPMELEWEQAIQSRLIRIPAEKLLAGDPRYNIVIKPGDTIHVPVDIIGEFAIMGNVNRAGFINITGRPMTLKMAIAAAGGLGPLAWPKHVEVVRRIGAKKEEIVLVDLDKIAAGEQPDFFIKPNDLINVGTEATTRWRAVLRNAFRAAYGFGFVYDRNFADIDIGTGFPFFHNF